MENTKRNEDGTLLLEYVILLAVLVIGTGVLSLLAAPDGSGKNRTGDAVVSYYNQSLKMVSRPFP